MGLFLHRRLPVLRLVAASAGSPGASCTGGSPAVQDAINEQAQQAFEATRGPDASPGASDATAELERLARLHASGALTDDEFSVAKGLVLRG
jgi:hypothetical protein